LRKIICDRCGNEITDIIVFNPGEIYAHYDIRVTTYTKVKHPNTIGGPWNIDLCPSCEKELSYWLHNKEAK
jgi:hypothetical protein